MTKFNHFEKRTINPITDKIAVTEQIVMSRAELEQKLNEARIDELERIEALGNGLGKLAKHSLTIGVHIEERLAELQGDTV